MANKIKCKNCGAEMDGNLSTCPYCGELNYKGAEKEYMEHLGDIKSSLEGLSSESTDEVLDELSNLGRTLKKSFIIIAVIILVFGGIAVVGIVISNTHESYYESKYGFSTYRDKVFWLSEYEPELNEMYANSEYDKILEFAEEHKNDNVKGYSYWKHYDFMELYACYSEYNSLKDNSMLNNSMLASMLYDVIKVQTYEEGNYLNISRADKDVLDELGAEMNSFYKDYLGLDEKEAEKIVDEICYENEHYYVNSSTCAKYIDEIRN